MRRRRRRRPGRAVLIREVLSSSDRWSERTLMAMSDDELLALHGEVTEDPKDEITPTEGESR